MNLFAVNELANVVQTADSHMFSVEYLFLENCEVNAHLQDFPILRGIHGGCGDKIAGFSMFISGFTAAVIAYLDSYYLFDTHSRKGQGSTVLQGKISVTKFCRFERHEKVYSSGIYTKKKPK